ncbi:hypothetical protein [Lysinibacillus sp. RS5]|uniref:hypothetical protein n=1 Tax=unclassified Lysinibacillus TaxID=2636778 RepID=UPI0035BE73C2
MEFEIIINPNFRIGIRDPEDTTISEALDNRHVNTQYFTMKWNNISLSINYGTQIAEGISDVIKMLEAIKKERNGLSSLSQVKHFSRHGYVKLKNVILKLIGIVVITIEVSR